MTMSSDEDRDTVLGLGDIDTGIRSLATQTQKNHEEVMSFFKDLTFGYKDESDFGGQGFESSTAGEARLPWATTNSLKARISDLEQQTVDGDAKLYKYEQMIDDLRDGWRKSKTELSKAKETTQGLSEMISGHEKAMMEAEERNSVLAHENRDLQRQLDRALNSLPSSSWLSFFG